MKQVISVPTRKGAVLEKVITDMHSFYHPPTSLPPLQVDERKKGKNGDHKVIIMAPLSNTNFKLERKKRIVKTRPLPKENFERFRKEFILHKWNE